MQSGASGRGFCRSRHRPESDSACRRNKLLHRAEADLMTQEKSPRYPPQKSVRFFCLFAVLSAIRTAAASICDTPLQIENRRPTADTKKAAIKRLSSCRGRDLNPHVHQRTEDFKSPASTISPPRLLTGKAGQTDHVYKNCAVFVNDFCWDDMSCL